MSRDLGLPAMNRASNRAVIRSLLVEAPLAAICSMRAEQIDRQRELEAGLQHFQAGRVKSAVASTPTSTERTERTEDNVDSQNKTRCHNERGNVKQ